jgi:VanZ family protein
MVNKVARFLKKYLFSIVAAIGILYLSLASPSALPRGPQIEGLDKIVHMIMYAAFAIILSLEASRSNRYRYYLQAILFPILYGGLMELLQHFFPPRTTDFFDFLANTVGVLLGYLATQLFLRKKK